MFPEGRTCMGDLKVLEKACELVTKAGAKSAKMLNVSGAFHSPYMESASVALAKVLDEAHIKMPTIKVYSNAGHVMNPVNRSESPEFEDS